MLIIGAGPAGLTAAYTLLQRQLARPIVLDMGQIAGGLSRTEHYHGQSIDLGGHRFFSRSQSVMAIWQAILPLQGQPAFDDRLLMRQSVLEPGGPDPEVTDRVMLSRNRVSRIYFRGHFFDYPLALNIKTLHQLGWGLSIKIALGYGRAVLKPRPEQSLEDFYINRFGKPLYQLFFEDYTTKLWGRHPRDIAPDWGAQRVKGLSLMRAVWSALLKPLRHSQYVETSLIESFHYPKLGPGQLWSAMAKQIEGQGGDIFYNAQVTQIEQLAKGYLITTVNSAGESQQYYGEAVFSSMAIRELLAMLKPAPPELIQSLAADLPYRDFMTCGVLVNRLAVKNETNIPTLNQLIPDCWIYIQDRQVKMGRVQIFNNWSPYLTTDPEHTVWLGLEYFATVGDALWTMPDADFKALAVAELVKIGLIATPNVLDQVVYRVPKAYPAYFDSYRSFAEIRTYLQQLPDFYCIGRNGQHRYNNMDHSMLTAIEAVNCFTQESTQDRLWSVHADETYNG
ncbi:MAG: NAD(P)/FAD-dependent oxidoreductase [Eubacteriales bacterium]|nr:NAD(P)/FAD-dependent oxidoreductase [Eubacteriales bacterium]